MEIIRSCKSLVKNAWFFGDSFTAGYGATSGFPYYEKYGPSNTFSSLLSKYFEAEEHNYGLPGECNNAIIKSITYHLPYFKKGDIVTISNTSPLRDLVPDKTTSKLISQKLFYSDGYPNSIGYKNKKISTALEEYCLQIREPYIPEWNHHYRTIFLNFVNYFESIGCKAIFWDYSVWSEEEEKGMKFENINQATNGVIYDLHWSYKGHRDAFEWLRDGINKGKKFLK